MIEAQRPTASRFPFDRWSIAVAAALLFAAGTLYDGTFSAPFVFDDFPAIRDNPTIRTLAPATAFAPPRATGLGGRPLANFSFALSHAIGGGDVHAHHVFNMLVHAASALLLFRLVRRQLWPERPEIALAAALLWFSHPLATAAVTYLSQRTELLMAFCWLLTLERFVHGRLIASVVACACGMLCKENMATAPLIVLLFDRTFVAGSFAAALRTRRRYYAGLAATWLILAGVLTTGLHQRSLGFGLGVSPLGYALTECRALLLYLKLALWPWPLVFDYGRAYEASPAVTIACVVAVALLLLWTARALARRASLGFAVAAFFLLLAPSSSFVPVAETPIAENRAYLPLAVIVVTAVFLLRHFIASAAWRVTVFAAGLVAFSALTIARNHDYSTELTLWSDTVAKRPQNARAHFNRGVVLLDLGRAAEATSAFTRSLELNPREPKAHDSLGNALLELGRPAEAIPHFERAVALEPNYPRAWFNYGTALVRAGRADDAIARFQHALQLEPKMAEAENALGNIFFHKNQPGRALPHYDAALRLDPALADAHYNAGSASLELGRIDDATAHLFAAARLKPADPEVRNHLGAALVRAGRLPDAIVEFETALRLKPDYADARDNLALVRAELSRKQN